MASVKCKAAVWNLQIYYAINIEYFVYEFVKMFVYGVCGNSFTLCVRAFLCMVHVYVGYL